MLKPNQNYLEREVLEGSPLQHILLLYTKAINSLKIARNLIKEGIKEPEEVKIKAENLTRAVDILAYLQACLDLEKGGEIAKNLKEIYEILIRELISANFKNDLKPIEDAIEILEKLRNAFAEIKVNGALVSLKKTYQERPQATF